MSKYGFVYVLSNESMPNLYKIGYTNGSPTGRAIELSRPTGVPTLFDLVCYGEMINPQEFEKQLHLRYDKNRSNKFREFFQFNIDEIMNLKIYIEEQSDTYTEGMGVDLVHKQYLKLEKEKGKQDGKPMV